MFSPSSPPPSIRKNKASAYQHPEVVDTYLRHEVSVGRVLGPRGSSTPLAQVTHKWVWGHSEGWSTRKMAFNFGLVVSAGRQCQRWH